MLHDMHLIFCFSQLFKRLVNMCYLPPVSNRFCDEWIQAFLNAAERCNPFLLRQILENFKLKVGKHHTLHIFTSYANKSNFHKQLTCR